MKSKFYFLNVGLMTIFIFLMSLLMTPSSVMAANLEGIWQGKLNFSGAQLRLVIHLTKTGENSYSATLDSPEQGAKGIPTSKVVVTPDSLIIEANSIGGRYEGKIVEANKISGIWKQSGFTMPLELSSVEKIEEPKRPQEPKEPFPYDQTEVKFENKQAGITLAGTLTTPRENGPSPAVILISGSGPQDRNETIFNHKPFRVIADYLTRQGIAVLRYDDRGVGASTGDFKTAITPDFASDVQSGIEFLKTNPKINSQKIGLIGHSEGGLVAPLVASQSKEVAFIILLAAPGLVGEKLLYLQGELIARASGASEEQIKRNVELQQKIFGIIIDTADVPEAEKKLTSMLKESYDGLTPEEQKQMGDFNVFSQSQIKSTLSPWFRYFLTYDPIPTLQKVKCPVLALTGEKDLQVPPKQNLPLLEAALKKAGNKNIVLKELPGLNHLFQTAQTGNVSEYGTIEETFSPLALAEIGEWIKKVVNQK